MHTYAVLDTAQVRFTRDDGIAATLEFDAAPVQVSATPDGACVVDAEHAVYCFDMNCGQECSHTEPRRVTGLPEVEHIDVSGTACALGVDRRVYCWGSNANGQLGTGSTLESDGSFAVEGVEDAVAISTGYQHACALLKDGTARCWGRNDSGQLGDHSFNDRPSSVAVLE